MTKNVGNCKTEIFSDKKIIIYNGNEYVFNNKKENSFDRFKKNIFCTLAEKNNYIITTKKSENNNQEETVEPGNYSFLKDNKIFIVKKKENMNDINNFTKDESFKDNNFNYLLKINEKIEVFEKELIKNSDELINNTQKFFYQNFIKSYSEIIKRDPIVSSFVEFQKKMFNSFGDPFKMVEETVQKEINNLQKEIKNILCNKNEENIPIKINNNNINLNNYDLFESQNNNNIHNSNYSHGLSNESKFSYSNINSSVQNSHSEELSRNLINYSNLNISCSFKKEKIFVILNLKESLDYKIPVLFNIENTGIENIPKNSIIELYINNIKIKEDQIDLSSISPSENKAIKHNFFIEFCYKEAGSFIFIAKLKSNYKKINFCNNECEINVAISEEEDSKVFDQSEHLATDLYKNYNNSGMTISGGVFKSEGSYINNNTGEEIKEGEKDNIIYIKNDSSNSN